MTRRTLGASLGAATLVATLALVARTSAKPPDLPDNPPVRIAPGPEGPGSLEPAPLLTPMGLELAPVPMPGGDELAPTQPIVTTGATDLLQFGLDTGTDASGPATDCPFLRCLATGSLSAGLGLAAACGHGCCPLGGGCPFLNGTAGVMAHLRPSERRALVTSLLFTAHPFLALTPVEAVVSVDGPCHGAGQACAPPAPETGPTCPYLRQQAVADRHVRLIAEPGLGREVLDNLRRLEEANKGLKEAKALARAGQTVEALKLLDRVRRLCPGSSYDEQVSEVLSEVFGGGYGTSAGEETQEYAQEDYERAGDMIEDLSTWFFEQLGLFLGYDLIECPAPEAICPAVYCGRGAPVCQAEQPAPEVVQRWLQSPVTADFIGTPLQIVLDTLRACQPVPFEVDVAALQAENVDLLCPITVKVEGQATGQTLTLVLHQARLCYVVRNGQVVVTTQSMLALPEAPAAPVAVDEPSANACPRCDELHAACVKRMKVRKLMDACHKAMAEGDHARAAKLARKAHRLDPDAVEADPLVYKLHLLAKKCVVPAVPVQQVVEQTDCPHVPAVNPPAAGQGAEEASQVVPAVPVPQGLGHKLSRRIHLACDGMALRELLEALGDAYGVKIVLDQPAAAEVGVSVVTPITLRLAEVELRYALEMIARQVKLVVIVKGEVVVFTAPSRDGAMRILDAAEMKRQQVKKLMRVFGELFKEGKYAEAHSIALRTVELDADDPVVVAAVNLAKMQMRVQEYKRIKKESGSALTELPQDAISNSADEPPADEVVAESSEARLERVLRSPINVNFTDAPLRTVLDDLRDTQGINIVPDLRALQEDSVDLDTPISIKFENLSLKSALNLILRQARLTWVVKDEVVLVTTPAALGANARLVERCYPVADLMAGWDQARLVCDPRPAAEALCDLVYNVLSPAVWEKGGGRGTVRFSPEAKVLLVCQTEEMHVAVDQFLQALRSHLKARRAAAEQGQQESAPTPTTDADNNVSLCPHLPPIDAGVVSALDAVLAEREAPAQGCQEEGPTQLLGGSFELGLSWGGLQFKAKSPPVAGVTFEMLLDRGLFFGWAMPAGE
jgi:hypothetical protein